MLYDVHVEFGDRSYPINIGYEVLDQIGSLILNQDIGKKCLVIADSNTCDYFHKIKPSLEKVGINTSLTIVSSGETSKSLDEVAHLHSICIKEKLDRNSFIIALGGGVIGDLAGYVAASYLRGIPFVQVPTSLLAMVDSSVGGKTGVNLKEGKNLVGAFHQPSLVLADIKTLETLPEREMQAGMAEVVKYGIIKDAEFFKNLEENYSKLTTRGDVNLLASVIGRCCEIKAEVVTNDEFESGLRAILNFGHTLGHAIENITGYSNVFIHGEAISIGMHYAALLSVKYNNLEISDVDRIRILLEKIGLPTKVNNLDWETLKTAMIIDKKSIQGVPRFVLASAIGNVSIGHEISEDILKEIWENINE